MIGRNCRIGRGAHITGCYLLDNVSVGDHAQVSHSLLCDGVAVGPHAMIFPGSVLSFKVSAMTAPSQCTPGFPASFLSTDLEDLGVSSKGTPPIRLCR